MANFYFVAGGVGSNKNIIGMFLARRYGIPLLYGEMFYNHKQFKLACLGTPFTNAESVRWAESMVAPLQATGGCVVACRHITGMEIATWETCGRVSIIHADATAEEMMANWHADQPNPRLRATTEKWTFNRLGEIDAKINAMEI